MKKFILFSLFVAPILQGAVKTTESTNHLTYFMDFRQLEKINKGLFYGILNQINISKTNLIENISLSIKGVQNKGSKTSLFPITVDLSSRLINGNIITNPNNFFYEVEQILPKISSKEISDVVNIPALTIPPHPKEFDNRIIWVGAYKKDGNISIFMHTSGTVRKKN